MWTVVVATTLFLAVASAERVKDDFAVIESMERALIMEALNNEVDQASDILQRAFMAQGQSYSEIGREQTITNYKPKKKQVNKSKGCLKHVPKEVKPIKVCKPKAPRKKRKRGK